MSDTPEDTSAKAEPVDAEFEPAPGSNETASKSGRKTPKTARTGRRLPWLTISLVTVFAGAIGGGTGYLIGKYGPDPANTALEGRLAALEAAVAEPDNGPQLDALHARLTTVEDELEGARLRAEGLEQLIRDVASLRDRVEALEAAPATGEAGSGTGEALAQLEQQVRDGLQTLRDRVNTLVEDTDTARSIAEQAQSSVQQALSMISQSGATGGGTGDGGGDAASAAAVSAIEARVATLETALERLNQQSRDLQALRERVAALADAEPDLSGLEALADRVIALEADVTALADIPPEPQSPAGPTSASLAERALAFAAVSRAAAGSRPFPVAVADLRRLWPSAPGLAALAEPAEVGAPTLDQLAASFPGDAIRAATGEAQMLFGVIRVERDGGAGPTAAIEAALDEGDLETAIARTRALEGEAALAASAWLARAEARLAVETSLSRMGEALARAEEG
jgi:hypothetical protein